jgi:hypothetical protein
MAITRKRPSSGGPPYQETHPEFPAPAMSSYSTPRTNGTYERAMLRPDLNGAAVHIARDDAESAGDYSGHSSEVVRSASQHGVDTRARDRLQGCVREPTGWAKRRG